MEMFPDQAACIAHFEQLRRQGTPECPHCESTHVNKRNETATGRIGRWNCHDCHSTFKVTSGTIFTGTKIALQKWFLAMEHKTINRSEQWEADGIHTNTESMKSE